MAQFYHHYRIAMTPGNETALLGSIDYADRFRDRIDYDRLAALRRNHTSSLRAKSYVRYQEALASLPRNLATVYHVDRAAVTIDTQKDLSQKDRQSIQASLKAFIPWKKGPFEIFGESIDAEWRSDLKWDRLLPHVDCLTDRIVGDIGCHNGYFMFRMLAHNPRWVVGFEPVAKHWFNFMILQHYTRSNRLSFERFGVEHLDVYSGFFDTIFCLGILYHHTDPVGILKKIFNALRTGGQLLVDCQGIPGEDSFALFPKGRYARAKGIWFLPTRACLLNWLNRAGFRDIDCFYAEPLSTSEQRRTTWAPIDSLADFLDPKAQEKTIEGYPAPWRFYVNARK